MLGDGTRLAAPLALWEAYDPRTEVNTSSIPELCERVVIRHGGQFNLATRDGVGTSWWSIPALYLAKLRRTTEKLSEAAC